MKRLLCWTAFMYILGNVLAVFYEFEIASWLGFIGLIACTIKILFSGNKKDYNILLLLCCLLLGYCRFSIAEDISIKPISKFIDKPVVFTGRISDLPILKEEGLQYDIQIKNIISDNVEHDVSAKIRLFCKTGTRHTYNYGDVLQISSEIYLPLNSYNRGGFDYRKYLRTKGVYAVSFPEEYEIKKIRNDTTGNWLKDISIGIRASAIQNIDNHLPEDEAGLLKGMMLGIRNDLPENIKTQFSVTGLSHLTAVSGMHLAILVAGITFLLRLLRIKRHIRSIILSLFIILFVFITGCTPSVLRAGIMTIIFLLGDLLNKDSDPLTSLSIAGLAILIYNPIFIIDIGFQLSFSATISLILFYKPIYKRLRISFSGIRQIASASIAAQLGTIIIVAYHYNHMSFVSIIANILIVPMVSFILLSGLALYILGSLNGILGQIIAGVCFLLLKLVLIIVGLISRLPLASIKVPSPSIIIILIYLLILIILYNLLQEKKNIFRIKLCIGILSLTIIVNIFAPIYSERYLEVTFINVGQGDCTLIRCPNGTNLLIDGGGSENEKKFSVGKNILLPYLRKNGIMNLDMIIVSHYHDDHVGGILNILGEMDVGGIFMPKRNKIEPLMQELIDKAEYNDVAIYYGNKGMSIDIDLDINLEVLYPDTDQLNNIFMSENDLSLVLKLNYQNNSFLFTGDIEKNAEEYIVARSLGLKSDVLKVPHHGSNTSTSDAFLISSSPKYAVISVGKNPFGHPSETVLSRLKDKNIEVYRTDINSTITFLVDSREIKKIRLFREGE